MDKVQRPSNSKCHTPASEIFRTYLIVGTSTYLEPKLFALSYSVTAQPLIIKILLVFIMKYVHTLVSHLVVVSVTALIELLF
jgi:hypothetical protein